MLAPLIGPAGSASKPTTGAKAMTRKVNGFQLECGPRVGLPERNAVFMGH